MIYAHLMKLKIKKPNFYLRVYMFIYISIYIVFLQVTVAKTLDYEKVQRYYLTIVATVSELNDFPYTYLYIKINKYHS